MAIVFCSDSEVCIAAHTKFLCSWVQETMSLLCTDNSAQEGWSLWEKLMSSVLNSRNWHLKVRPRRAGKLENQQTKALPITLFLSVHCIRCLEKYVRMRQVYTGVFLMQSSTPQLPAGQWCHLFAQYILFDEFILMHFKFTQSFVSYGSLCQWVS